MRAAHVFVMPSRRESFGFVYLEAMAAGCAVIGAPWESQREIFNEGVAGINCQPDANAVSEAMHLLIENETRRQDLAIAGHQRYLDRYTPEASALAYRKAIMSCL